MFILSRNELRAVFEAEFKLPSVLMNNEPMHVFDRFTKLMVHVGGDASN